MIPEGGHRISKARTRPDTLGVPDFRHFLIISFVTNHATICYNFVTDDRKMASKTSKNPFEITPENELQDRLKSAKRLTGNEFVKRIQERQGGKGKILKR
jgi:hypothetical protein